jgi:hypothetical protein
MLVYMIPNRSAADVSSINRADPLGRCSTGISAGKIRPDWVISVIMVMGISYLSLVQ